MTPTTVTLDLAGSLRAPTTCPACGADDFAAEYDGNCVTLLCRTCHRCWDPGFGRMTLVDPQDCRTCAEQPACLHHARAREGV